MTGHSDTARARSQDRRVPRGFPRFIGQKLAVLLSDSNEELVDAHRRVNGHFAAEKCFDIMLLWDLMSKKDRVRGFLLYRYRLWGEL